MVLGGDGSVATVGFWSALTIANHPTTSTTFLYRSKYGWRNCLFSEFQTPGGNIAANLQVSRILTIISGDGTNPQQASELVAQAHSIVHYEKTILLRLTVPRLNGLTQDTQTYKSSKRIAFEQQHDPLPKLKNFVDEFDINRRKWHENSKKCQKCRQ